MNQKTIHLLFLLLILLSTSCSLTRTLPEGGYLYRGSKVKIKTEARGVNSGSLEINYKALLNNPKPNKRFLGIMWGVRFHNLLATQKEKGFKRWLQKKLGAEPVIFNEQMVPKMEKLMENIAFNDGFFHVKIESEIEKKRHKAKVKYTVRINKPYLIGGKKNMIMDSLIRSQVDFQQDASLLKIGEPYTLSALKRERERIAISMRKNGFYFFVDDYLIFEADTTQKDKKVYLALKIKEEAPEESLKKQRINKIFVYPNQKEIANTNRLNDTIDFDGLSIIAASERMTPITLRNAITLESGTLYSIETHQKTLERLSFLRNYQFIDIQFKALETTDTLLNVIVSLTPRKRESIEGAVGIALKSGLYFGPEISITYANRNLFKGAEQLRVTAFGNYNFPLANNIASQNEQGLNIELSKPGLLIPFRKKNWPKQMVAQTKMTSNNSQEKTRLPLYSIVESLDEEEYPVLTQRLRADTTFTPYVAFIKSDFSLAYQWRKRPDIQHELAPITLQLQVPNFEIDEIEKLLLGVSLSDGASSGLFLNLQKMLIIKPGYTFLYDSRLRRTKTHNHFYRGKVAIAGNKLLSVSDPALKNALESQFFQLENDIRYYYRQSKRSTIGFRFSTNISIPFKSEVILPFFNLYSIGGPNSVRAFGPRLVGPGTVEPAEEVLFFTGTGDLLLESSLEWRLKLTQLFELGLFVDSGNVWLLKGGSGQNEKATFKINDFYNQLATGTGIGFRFDFDVILIRSDFSIPVTKPWLPEGDRFVLDQTDLGNYDWRKRNLTFYLAFGYSF